MSESMTFALEDLPCPAALVRGDALFVNARLAAMIGRSRAELSTIDAWFTALYGDDAATERARYESARRTSPDTQLQLEIETPSGGRVYVELRASHVDRGELWILTYVTDQVREKERFRVLFENSSDAQMLFDENGIIDCNQAAVDMLRCTKKEEVLLIHPARLSPPLQPDGRRSDEKCIEMDGLARANGKHRFDWMHRRVDGEDFPVEVTLTATDLAGRPVVLVEWHEISERLAAEAEVRAARDEAHRAAKAKAEFLATMSHEIRTPLNAVIGMTRRTLARLMGGDITVDSEVGHGSIFRVSVVLPSRDTGPTLPPRNQRALIVVPNPAVRSHLDAQLADIGVDVIAVADGDDAEVALEESTSAPFDYVFVDAHIPVVAAERLLRFVRSIAPSRVTKSIALRPVGMPAAAGFDGTMRKPVRTKDFARALDEATREDSTTEIVVDPDEAITPRHVLLVDDNVVNQRVATAMLRRLGCIVAVAADGLEAIEVATHASYDVILMDCQMPRMDGFEATRRLRAIGLDTPILALTANALDGDRQRCLAAGMDDHLAKPITMSQLTETLKRWTSTAAGEVAQS